MLSSPDTRERWQAEEKADVSNRGTLGAADSLRVHWPEYLMEAGEAGIYRFSACSAATLLWHPASPIQRYLPSDPVRRLLMGVAMGATVVAIALTPWGKQSGAHFNPAFTFTFYRLRKVALWDAVFYSIAQLLGAVNGVALASLVLHGAPAHKAIHYADTIPGIYGIPIAFVAELAISFILMSAVLFALNHEAQEPYSHYVAATLIATYMAPLGRVRLCTRREGKEPFQKYCSLRLRRRCPIGDFGQPRQTFRSPLDCLERSGFTDFVPAYDVSRLGKQR